MDKRVPGRCKRSLLIATVAVALAACAGAVTVTGHKNLAGSYSSSELYVVATGDNQLRTIIVGNPFDTPQADFEAAVLAAMAGSNMGPRLNLSTDPKQEDPRKRHVLLVFNLPGRGDADALCSATPDALPADPAPPLVSVTGVYCAGNLPLSQATARSGPIGSVDSAEFRELMSQLAIALFPFRDRRDRNTRE